VEEIKGKKQKKKRRMERRGEGTKDRRIEQGKKEGREIKMS
jgi:hypothetical protein